MTTASDSGSTRRLILTRLTRLACLHAAVLVWAETAYAQSRLMMQTVVRDSTSGEPIRGDVLLQRLSTGAVVARGSVRDGQIRLYVAASDTAFLLTVRGVGYVRFRASLGRDSLAALRVVYLRKAPAVLAQVNVVGARRVPPPSYEFDPKPLVENGRMLVANSVTLGERDDIAIQLATVPGVQLENAGAGVTGVSAFGAGAGQNAVTLGGMPVSASTIPRTAAMLSRVETSAYDVGNTGFGGVQLATSLIQGGALRNGGFLFSLNPPDGVLLGSGGRTLGGAQFGAGMSGPLPGKFQFFSVHGQVTRSVATGDRWRDQVSAEALQQAEPWLRSRGVPSVDALLPSRTSLAVITRLDRLRPAGWSLTFQSIANLSRVDALVAGAQRLPSTGQEVSSGSWSGVLDAAGPIGAWMGRSKLAVVHQGLSLAPETAYPAVLLRLPLSTGSEAGVVAGGGLGAVSDSRTSSVHLQQCFERFAGDQNQHRVKVIGEIFAGRAVSEATLDAQGQYTLWTPSDTSGLILASYARALGETRGRADLVRWAVGIGDAWRPSSRLRIEGGIRLDGAQLRGLDDAGTLDAFPSRQAVVAGPRLGVEWGFGRASARIGDLSGGTVFTARAGVARLTSTPGADAWAPFAQRASGDAAILLCTGAAIPNPPWAAGGVAPVDACVRTPASRGTPRWDGTPFAGTTDRLVTGITWWNAPFATALSSNLTVSRHVAERMTRDDNLRGAPAWTNTAEGGRPVFAAPGAWDPNSARAPLLASRADVSQGWLWRVAGSGRSESAVLALSLSPRRVGAGLPNWFLQYSAGIGRELRSGWDGSTAGDPRGLEWMRSSTLPRHSIVGFLQLPIADWLRWSTNVVASQGGAFTPTVLGDVNGDGATNDRVATAALLELPAQELRSLQRSWSCLSPSGAFVAPNSCAAGWNVRAATTLELDGRTVGLPSRSTVTLIANNILTPIARAAFGDRTDRLMGVGPRNPFLLVPTGFDTAQQRFRYRVNQDFGRPLVGPLEFTAPLTFSLEVRIPAFGGPLAQLERRAAAGASAAQLRQVWSTTATTSLAQLVTIYADSLLLAPAQRASVDSIVRAYRAEKDSLFAAFGSSAARGSVSALNEALWDAAVRTSRDLRRILTTDQWALFAPLVQGLVSESVLLRSRREGGVAPP